PEEGVLTRFVRPWLCEQGKEVIDEATGAWDRRVLSHGRAGQKTEVAEGATGKGKGVLPPLLSGAA
ncbi:hypothetical protein KI387_037671, partial [Taxus chinensis]